MRTITIVYSISGRNAGGQSPLFAASSGYYDIVRLLTAHGALSDENDSNA
jgi:ankyrin repeat protein